MIEATTSPRAIRKTAVCRCVVVIFHAHKSSGQDRANAIIICPCVIDTMNDRSQQLSISADALQIAHKCQRSKYAGSHSPVCNCFTSTKHRTSFATRLNLLAGWSVIRCRRLYGPMLITIWWVLSRLLSAHCPAVALSKMWLRSARSACFQLMSNKTQSADMYTYSVYAELLA